MSDANSEPQGPEAIEHAHDPEVLQLAAKVFDLARHGDTDTVAAYVDAGVPANLTNDKGDSLVMLAAYHGHPATVEALLQRGADADRPNDRGQTPLMRRGVQGGGRGHQGPDGARRGPVGRHPVGDRHGPDVREGGAAEAVRGGVTR